MRSHRGLLSIAVILLAILTLAAAFALAGCEKDDDPFDPDVQESPGAIDFNAAIYRKVRSFFCDASYCSVKSANDPDEGYVIKLISKNAKGNKDSIPEVEGSGFPGYAYVRVCTWGHFRDKVTGTEFVHMNLHLDINGEKTKAEGNQMRADQMAVVVRFAQRFKGLPVFVSGDFNTLRHKVDGEGIHEAICLVESLSSVPGADGNECRLELKDTRLNAARTVDSSRAATLTKYFDKNYSKYEPDREPIDYIFYDANFFEP